MDGVKIVFERRKHFRRGRKILVVFRPCACPIAAAQVCYCAGLKSIEIRISKLIGYLHASLRNGKRRRITFRERPCFHARDVALTIQALRISLRRQNAVQRFMCTAANCKVIFPRIQQIGFAVSIIAGHVLHICRDGQRFAFPGSKQFRFAEIQQLHCTLFQSAHIVGCLHIQLHRAFPRDTARIRHRYSCRHRFVLLRHRHRIQRLPKCRVAHAIAKWICYLFAIIPASCRIKCPHCGIRIALPHHSIRIAGLIVAIARVNALRFDEIVIRAVCHRVKIFICICESIDAEIRHCGR